MGELLMEENENTIHHVLRPLLRWAGGIVLGLIATVLLILSAYWLAAQAMLHSRRAELDAAWKKTLPSIETLDARYRPEPANRAASELDECIKPLGLNISIGLGSKPIRRNVSTLEEPDPTAVNIWEVEDYVRRAYHDPESDAEPPPPPVVKTLAAQAAALEKERDILNGSDKPRWKFTPDSFHSFYIPDLMAAGKLHQLLWARALSLETMGKHGEAVTYVRAAWNLVLAFGRRNETISCLVAVVMARRQAVLLPKVPIPSQQWERDVHNLELKGQLVNSLYFDAWSQYRAQEAPGLLGMYASEPGWRKLEFPLIRLDLIQILRRKAVVFAELEKFPDCPFRPADFEGRLVLPGWHVGGDIKIFDVYCVWNRAIICGISFQLADRALYAMEGKPYPAVSPLPGGSGCPGNNWAYTRLPGHRLEIRFTRDVDSWMRPRARTPMKVVVRTHGQPGG
jgi:hypothetical protein